ncbi:nucleotide sugar dehydrogenase [Gammaproteobacteria bacterium]|nr:nucleotide sugar dehydrogenase [Gammaproteobacteria bacterium]
MKLLDNIKVGILGLGYVGLPLAVAFSRKYSVVGFDVNERRVDELNNGLDSTLEVAISELHRSDKLQFTHNPADLFKCDVYIVTVPTPIDKFNRPDLKHLLSASEILGSLISPGNVVIYESTVYPGATEEECVPIIEAVSGLRFNKDFFVGYSPERINPGDKNHKVVDIVKVTSGSTRESAEFIDSLYSSVITAGTSSASSIKVAEAAKVIENIQRDVNIALINELAMIFERLGIDTNEVLEAASTKWNFLNFKPGLVGGHCIGVDPFYLTHKCESIGYRPEMILAGRRINDGMAAYAALRLVKAMINKGAKISDSKILIMGLTFKENCPDTRNSKVFDVVSELSSYGAIVDVFDPWINEESLSLEQGLTLLKELRDEFYDAVVVAVRHKVFIDMGVDTIKGLGKSNSILFDLKNCFDSNHVDLRL